MKSLAYVVANAYYYVGDIISKIIEINDFLFRIGYPIYHNMMNKSLNLSDRYDLGIWK